jgi:Ser/Thr protein kinase RdoA (MazF antagonist)
VPIARFAGAPVATFGARAWSLLSYLDGDVPGWDPGYAVAAHGSFIARFHDAVADLLVGDRPGSIVAPSALDATIDHAALTRVMGHDRAAWFVDALSTMTGRLRALRYEARAQQLIHGDFTTRNVVASGTPLAPVGLLDFAHARREVAIADLAFGLWQAGRSSFETHDFDGSRITALVAGYHAVRPLTDDDIAVLPLLIRARGFVLIPRWIARGETGVVEALSRVEFLIAHERDIADAVATAIG